MTETKKKISYMISDVTIQRIGILGDKSHRKPGALIDFLFEKVFEKDELLELFDMSTGQSSPTPEGQVQS